MSDGHDKLVLIMQNLIPLNVQRLASTSERCLCSTLTADNVLYTLHSNLNAELSLHKNGQTVLHPDLSLHLDSPASSCLSLRYLADNDSLCFCFASGDLLVFSCAEESVRLYLPEFDAVQLKQWFRRQK